MSLITCPECAHEVASTATACPNCGHLFARPVVQPRVVVQEFVEDEGGFPKWAFIPLGAIGLLLLIFFFVWMRNSDTDDQRNINVRVAQTGNTTRETTTSVPSNPQPNQVVVPPTSSQPNQVVVPPTVSQPSTVTTVPSTETIAPDKGSVQLEAKVMSKNGGSQPVRGTKFFLLKKDLDSILNDANIENDTGQSLTTALGMSIVYPDRYGDIKSKAMNAIGRNAVYSATTDAGGKLQLKDVKPNNYYLFAITKAGDGYALWSSSVTIQPGQNSLILEPVSPTTVEVQPE